MANKFNDITSHPIQGYRGEDLYGNDEELQKIKNNILNIKQREQSYLQQIQLGNKGFVGYESIENPNLTKIQTIEGLDYGKSRYDDALLVAPTYADIQNRRAEQQSGFNKIMSGIGKGAVLAGTTFLSGLALWGYGVPLAVFSSRKDENGDRLTAGQQWSKLWDNEVTRTLQSISDAAEEAMPNYYTTQEQNNPLGHVFSANFLGDKLLKNFGFMIGAFYSGNVIGAITKATRLPALMSKLTGRLSTAKNTLTAIGAFSSAVGEGAIEALHNSTDWAKLKILEINDLYEQKIQDVLQSDLGNIQKQYSLNLLEQERQKELEHLELEKARMGNMNLLLNIPILTFSNMLQFARLYSGGYNTQRAIHNAARKAQQGKTAAVVKAFGKSFGTEGSEEFLQRVASTSSGYYYNNNIEEFRKSWIDPASNKNMAEAVSQFMNATANSLKDNIKDPTAIEEFLIGGISGMLGMPSFGRANTKDAWLGKDKPIGLTGGIVGQYQEIRDEQKRASKYTDIINTWLQDEKYVNYFRGLSAQAFYDGKLQQNIDDKNIFEFKNNELNQLVTQIITFSNVGKLGDLKTMVNDSLSNLTDEDLESIYNSVLQKDGTNPFNINNESPLLTNEGKQAMRDKLEKSRREIIKVIDNYQKISENLDIQYGEKLSDEQLAELSWMYTSIENFKDRQVDLYKDFVPAIQQILDTKDNIVNEVIKDLESQGLIRSVYQRSLKEPSTSKIVSQTDKQLVIQRGKTKTTYNLEGEAKVTENSDGSFTVDFITANKPTTGKYTVVKKGVISFIDDMIKDSEGTSKILDDLKNLINEKPERAIAISNNDKLYEFIITINKLYNNNSNKDEIAQKIEDFVKLQKMQKGFQERAQDYVENPNKSIEEIEELKKKVVQEEQNKKKKEEKDKLKNAKTLKDFKSLIENIDKNLANTLLKELVNEGNTIAITYSRMGDYIKEVINIINNYAIENSVKPHWNIIREVTKEIFEKYFTDSATTLSDLTNPDKVNTLNIQQDSLNTLKNVPQDNANLYIDYAKYILQQAIINANKKEAFKQYIAANHQNAKNVVQKPIIDNSDFSETSKTETIDYNSQNIYDTIQVIINGLSIKQEDKKDLLEDINYIKDLLNSTLELEDFNKIQFIIDRIYDQLGNSDNVNHDVAEKVNQLLSQEYSKKKSEFKEVEIQNISTEEMVKDNLSIQKDSQEQSNNTPHKYYIPTIQEFYNGQAMPNTSNTSFTEEQKRHIEALHKYLTDIEAFSYVDKGKLKVGEDVYFIIDPSISNNSDYSGLNPSTIFMAVKKNNGEYQIIGSLQDLKGAISKFQNLDKLIQDINTEYSKYTKENKDKEGYNPKFIFSKTSKINATKAGHLLYTENNEEVSLSEILNNTDDEFKKELFFGVMRNGKITVPGFPELVMQDWIPDKTNREGRIYMLIPTNKHQYTYNGRQRVYYPVAIRVSRFSKEFLDESTIAQYKTRLKDLVDLHHNNNSEFIKPVQGIIENILRSIVELSFSNSKSDVQSVQHKLSKYLNLYFNQTYNDFDINFDFFTTKEKQQNGLSISRYPIERDSNGVRINNQERVLSSEGLPNNGRVYFNEAKNLDDILSRAEQILDIIMSLNLGFNIKRTDLSDLNKGGIAISKAPIVMEHLITSDIKKAEIVNSWFTIDYYDNGEFVKAEPTKNLNHTNTSNATPTVNNTIIETIDGIQYELKDGSYFLNGKKLEPNKTLYLQYVKGLVAKSSPVIKDENNNEWYYTISDTGVECFIRKGVDLNINIEGMTKLVVSNINDTAKFLSLKSIYEKRNTSIQSENQQQQPKKSQVSDLIYNQEYIPEGVTYTTKKGNTGKVHHKIYEFQYNGDTIQVFIDNSEKELLITPESSNNSTFINNLNNRLDLATEEKNPIKLRYIMPDGMSIGIPILANNVALQQNIIESINKNFPKNPPSKSQIQNDTETGANAVSDFLDEGNFREIQDSTEFEIWDQEKELEWLRKNLPQLNDRTRLEIIKGLIPIMQSGKKAWGRYRNGIITLSDIAAKGTLYHESFHYIFDMLLTLEEQNSILEEAKNIWGNKSKLELEEELAEAFRQYVMNQEEQIIVNNKTVSLGKRVLQFFKSLFVKQQHINKSLDVLNQLFKDINTGKYANKQPIRQSVAEKYSQEQYTQEMQEIKDKAITDSTFMKAPNGNSTNLTERQWLQVRTKAFKEWFGDWENNPENSSKVINENGEPLVVYHGSPAKNIREFKISKRKNIDNRGVFFTQTKKFAKLYGRNIYEVFLNIKNPLSVDYKKLGWTQLNIKTVSNVTGLTIEELESTIKPIEDWSLMDYIINIIKTPNISNDKKTYSVNQLMQIVTKHGYDGLMAYNTLDAAKNPLYGIFSQITDQYVVINPNQIKSATDNIGTFSRQNDDIRYREAGINNKEDLEKAYFNKTLFEFLNSELKEKLLNAGISENTYNSMLSGEQEYIRHCVDY